MAGLTLRCFGAFEVSFDGIAVVGFPTEKIRALFAYLAVEIGQPHRRDVLAALFWPEMSQTMALTNLRVGLYRLRQTLEQASPDADAALNFSTRQTLQLDRDTVTVDVVTFRALLAACTRHGHDDVRTCDACLERLAEVAELYRGEFLAGVGLADAPAFEEWLLLHRETFHQQVIVALHTLVEAYAQRSQDDHAHHYANRLLALDPLREDTHRQLMRILARRGLRAQALAQYERCRHLLLTELGVVPDPETVALAEQIRGGGRVEISAEPADARIDRSASLPDYAPHSLLWGGVPEVARLYGRSHELAELERWLVQDRCRLVALLGMGGIGKTTLAATVARNVAAHFDRILWRSLLNAPPPDELLRDLLQSLDDYRRFDLPASLDQQLALLIDQLRGQRCLLLFDNFESIFQLESPGQVRSGYEPYAQLIYTIAESPHRSTLLLTSRERPLSLARREEDTPLVRTLTLSGLANAGGQAMLAARGISGSERLMHALVQNYSGNPLALKLVAQTVHELFAGDVAAFLADAAPIFDDIRILLEQQFQRLSALEQELLIWLAVEREPITFPALRANLATSTSSRAVVEALRALQRRSLVEQSESACALQNVLIEFLTDYLVEQAYREFIDDAFPLPAAISFLHRFALLKATAREYVRASQDRLILQPLAHRLVAHFGRTRLIARLQQMLATLRSVAPPPGYTAGNLLNLLLHLGVDVRGYDFSQLAVWQAYLQGRQLQRVNFRGADLRQAAFTHALGEVLGVQFSAGGWLIASLIQETLCVWCLCNPDAGIHQDEHLIHAFHTPGVCATIVTFSTSGRLLASGDTDRRVRVWDVAQGELLFILPEFIQSPWAMAFSPDERWLASSSGDGAIHLWDMLTGEHVWTRQAHHTSVPALAFAPDGRTLASGDVDGVIFLWRTAGDDASQPLHRLHGHTDEVHALVFDAAGVVLASGSHDHTIRLWNVASGVSIHHLQGHTQVIRTLALSPDGRTLASGGGDAFVCVWDMDAGEMRHTLLTQENSNAYLAFNANGRQLVTVAPNRMIILWDVASGRRIDALQIYSNQLYALAFNHDSSRLVSGGKDCQVRIWNIDDETYTPQILQGHTFWIRSVDYDPTGIWIASAGNDHVIHLWEADSGRLIRVLSGHTDDVEALHFNPDGQRLVSASRDMTLRVWDVRSGQVLAVLHGHSERVYTCAFRPDGQQVASGSIDRTICLWNMQASAGHKLTHTLRGHTNAVRSVTYAPDGRYLISTSYDHTLRIWNSDNGNLVDTLSTQHSTILSAAFHPDGAVLATGSSDNMVRLWEIAPWRLRCTLRGHTNGVECVRFSPDGRWLASASADETIRLWDVRAVLAAPDANHPANADLCRRILRGDGPYAGMDITGVTGISTTQRATLLALGAQEA